MGMGIVSDKDFDIESSNSGAIREESSSKSESIPSPDINSRFTPQVVLDPEMNGVIVETTRGRGHNPATPQGLRKLVGEESVINGRQSALELAASVGISPSSVSAYAHGATSTATYDTPNTPLSNHLKESRLRVQKRARNKLMAALNHITVDKLADAKPRDLAGIARDMSAVIKDMEPEKEAGPLGTNGPQFIFYAPQFRDERHYDTIDAKE